VVVVVVAVVVGWSCARSLVQSVTLPRVHSFTSTLVRRCCRYTMLTQGKEQPGTPDVKKCIIVTPTSLVGNWAQEFDKWVPNRFEHVALSDSSRENVCMRRAWYAHWRVRLLRSCGVVCGVHRQSVRGRRARLCGADFTHVSTNPRAHCPTYDDVLGSPLQVMKGIRNFLNVDRIKVMVLSYETFRRYVELFLTKAETCCDLLILDEAHRLKNNATGTSVALSQLPCRRRVLLSGTPLQNDLVEFFAIVNFTNPGVLGTPSHFRRHYQSPILTGREPDSTEEEDKLGKQRSQDLSNVVNDFILRRSNELNRKHLPEKIVSVVCIRLTPLQRKIYQHMLMAKEISLQQEGAHTRTLPTINALKKLCNHPKLIFDDIRAAQVAGTLATAAHGFQDARSLFPADFEGRQRGKTNQAQIELAGKMNVLAQVRCEQCMHTCVRE
jgi:SNF2 family DNA or RNA helicase